MKTNSQTLIVSMPVYNAEKTLKDAIDSVLGQSYRNLRLIIVDDNSTDNSLEIAGLYLKDERVTVLSNNLNMGAYYCRNTGIAWMQDETWGYFTTHDADDISFEHRYLQLIRMLQKPRTSGVQDGWRRVSLETEEFIKENMTIAHAIFKRKVFDKIGYFETTRFGADWEYWKRTLSAGKSFGWVFVGTRKVWGKSYVHENNITTLIPEGSPHRKEYMKQSLKKIFEMERAKNWYVPFEINYDVT